MELEGVISGVGEEETRYNEISSDTVASVRNWIMGYPYGIIGNPATGASYFNCSKSGRSAVTVFAGIAYAYGYYGISDSVEISFLNPPLTQYHMIYLEWNKSVIPNTFRVKSRNNYASPQIYKTTFRGDVLSFMKTGVFQLPVAIVAVGKNGVQEITDLRSSDTLYPVYRTPLLTPYPYKAEYADSGSDTEIEGTLKNGVTAATIYASDSSGKIATTKYTDKEIQKNIINL